MTIRAAGGLLWRRRNSGVEVALVHRARYDDWTLPKGKLAPGESELEAAAREVGEETGASVRVGHRLRETSYVVGSEPKTVSFWAMEYLGGEFRPSGEVDQLRWVDASSAAPLLSYDTDRSVLSNLAPIPDAVVLLVRHAKAGDSSEWDGEDRARPLEPAGVEQARRLESLLALFAPTRVLSADLVRCRQTVEPLAQALATVVADAPAFADQRAVPDPAAAVRALCALATPGAVTVLCSQGDTIPLVVQRITGRDSAQTRKGAFWALGFCAGRCVRADYYPL